MIVLPELARLSLKANLAIEFAVWCFMRECVTQSVHDSHFTKKHAKNLSHNLRFTTRHWTRIFNNGNTVFWGNDGRMLHMRSLKRVVKQLEVITGDKIDTREMMHNQKRVGIDATDTTQVIKAKLYHVWFMARGSVTMARDTIQDLFGLSHDQQRAYEAILGDRIRVYTNHAHIDADDYADNPRELPSHTYNFGYDRLSSDDKYTARTMYAYQLPNTFVALPFNAYMKAPRTSKTARKACLVRTWTTNKHHVYKTLYHANMRDLEANGSNDSYVYVGFQHTKRIWRTGQYL